MRGYVLDACALIAFFEGEQGADQVGDILLSGLPVHIAAINVLEVCYDVQRTRGHSNAAREVIKAIRELGIQIEWEMTETWVLAASTFKSRGRLSLADAIALALAQSFNVNLVTADHHEFDPLERAGLASFEWIR